MDRSIRKSARMLGTNVECSVDVNKRTVVKRGSKVNRNKTRQKI